MSNKNKPSNKFQCGRCKHLIGWWRCKAYPYGFPRKYALGLEEHDSVMKNQKGDWVFEPRVDFNPDKVNEDIEKFKQDKLTHRSIYNVSFKDLIFENIISQGYRSEEWIIVKLNVEITSSDELLWHEFQIISKTQEKINLDISKIDMLLIKSLESKIGVAKVMTGQERFIYSLDKVKGEEKKEFLSVKTSN